VEVIEKLGSFLVNNFCVTMLQLPSSISAHPCFCKQHYAHIFPFVPVKEETGLGAQLSDFSVPLQKFVYCC